MAAAKTNIFSLLMLKYWCGELVEYTLYEGKEKNVPWFLRG